MHNDDDVTFKGLFLPLTTKKVITFLFIIGFIVFFNGLFNGFVLDDNFQIITNPYVRSGQYLYYLTSTIGPYYRPLMFIIYTFLYQAFQLNPFYYHLIQLLFHICNAIFIFLLFQHFSKKKYTSFILSILFLIHPLNVETVAYIANLQDVLFVFFGLLALLILFRSSNKLNYLILSVLLFLSLMSKETGILFAFIVLLYAFFIKKSYKIVTLFCVIGSIALYFLVRFLSVGWVIKPYNFETLPINTILSASFIERVFTIPKIIYFYIFTFCVPVNLSDQFWVIKSTTVSNFIIPSIVVILFIAILIFFGIALKRKNMNLGNKYWFFFVWFWIGIGFHLQILPLDKTIADRWFYFPLIGLLGILLFLLPEKLPKARNIVLVVCMVLLAAFSLRTIYRLTDWRNQLTLSRSDLATDENASELQYNYGYALMKNGRCKEAVPHFEKALLFMPKSDTIMVNLGACLLISGNLNQAKEAFTQAVQVNENAIQPYRNLVFISLLDDKPTEAEKLARKALSRWPNDPILLKWYGVAEYFLGKKENAKQAFDKSLSIMEDPNTLYYEQQLANNLPIELTIK